MKKLQATGPKVLFILGLAVALFLLLPVLSYDDLTYQGYEVVFGKELMTIDPFDLGEIASARLPFSPLALFAFGLPLVGGIIAIVSRKFVFLSLVLFVVSLFLLSALPREIDIVYTVGTFSSSAEVDWNMGIGLIGALVATGAATIIAFLMTLDTIIAFFKTLDS